ncbi:VCBS repeat-containing protein [Spirosoma linguale]|uniref:ASPIC/UnbV domain protein n=1 Tax=Spirosoma linguale (strain ATCC 33905 / DSM 74 / LMG 10896 / Claus 1) TaxID=504472 RepID=D2QD29_SPILD|nr:ASPIC/UnbV domain protein [Spirosoma linguale DSM 74]
MINKLILLPITLFTLSACHKQPDPLFVKLTAEETGVNFVNRSLDKKNFNIFNYRNFYNGGGVAIGDVNNDGLPDLFLTSNFEENKLYLNKGGMKFTDVTKQAGIIGKKFWSTGVTFADVNGDGLLDIYVCNSGSRDERGNQLYINEGVKNGVPVFTEKAKEYGLWDGGFSTHAAFFDYDRDGDLDMYLLNNSFTPMDRLGYANMRETRDKLGGHKLFENRSEEHSLSSEERVARSGEPSGGSKKKGSQQAGKEAKPLFVDVSEEAGIYGSLIGFGLGITIGDVNNDNWLDIYISNDFYERDYLYINQKGGRSGVPAFKEDIENEMGHISLASMGADIADVNNDGNLDIFVTDMLPDDDYRLKTTTAFESYELGKLKESRDFFYQDSRNMLHLNNGDGTFSEIGRMAGTSATDWSWGALLFDMDMDGRKDIFVANGILKDLTDQDYMAFLASNPDLQPMIEGTKKFDYKEYVDKMGSRPLPNYAYRNMGDGMKYENKAADWGLGEPSFSNGSAYGDLDNDGDLDLVVNNNDAPVSIFANTSVEKNHKNFLRVQLDGYGYNRNAIGAKVYVYQEGANGKPQTQFLQQMPNRGFESSVDLTMVFGLDNNPAIDSLVVIWPDDKKQLIRQPKANTTLSLAHKNADQRALFSTPAMPGKRLFQDITESSKLNYVHKENEFVDYDRDGLLKQMLSREGPALAVGDINGDGLDDVFLGGAVDMPRSLYVQRADGTFYLQKQPFLLDAIYTEDVAATFFDADGDKDLDLYVATGGNEFADSTYTADRLYLNDGKGNLTWNRTLPRTLANNSCVVAADFDLDGDQDLFVGARMNSGRYGQNPDQLLLVNDGKGNFRKATRELMPFSANIGMVTDAVWADIDHDRYPDLVLVGDWMPITVLRNKRGKGFEQVDSETLTNSGGWWNTIQAADLDNDGDIDFIAGNLGLNSRMVASVAEPAHLYSNDFDQNGSYDQIITCFRPTTDGRDGTMETRECVMVQKPDLQKRIPSIKTKYLKHVDYAKAGLEDIFSAQQRQGMTVKTVQTAETSVLINDGKGNFTRKALPVQAQTSPIHAILTNDYNGDGKQDLLLTGNFFDVLTEVGRYDANYGLLLTGDGKGDFVAAKPAQTGFFVRGQVRRMTAGRGANGKPFIVLAKNNDKAQVFTTVKTLTP